MTHICTNCNIEFQGNRYRNEVFCSNRCAIDKRIERSTVTAECPVCNKLFTFKRYKPKTYCGRSCFGKLQAKANLNTGVPWNKGKPNYGFRGEKNPRWDGGVSNSRHKDMGSIEYKQWRDAVFYRDNFTCQVCDVYGGDIHADHIKSWKDYPELRHDITNGRTLCVPCHYYVTFKKAMPTTSMWGRKTARVRRLR